MHDHSHRAAVSPVKKARTGRRIICLAVALSLMASGGCFAEQPAGGPAEQVNGIIGKKDLGTEKDVTYRCNILPEADHAFVLLAFEGSRMDPRKEDGGLIWNEGLRSCNVIDFAIADELCGWQKKKWEKTCDLYASAVLDALTEHFGNVKAAGVYAFSKGASAADAVCRKLKEAGLELSFVWLNDAFTTHGLPYVTELTENNEILLYSRYSRDERVNGLCKKLHQKCGNLPNVDSRHISTYHGGLVKYETFTEEIAAAIEKASFVP